MFMFFFRVSPSCKVQRLLLYGQIPVANRVISGATLHNVCGTHFYPRLLGVAEIFGHTCNGSQADTWKEHLRGNPVMFVKIIDMF